MGKANTAGIQLGIFAKTFPGSDASTVLAAVRAAGYTATQYNMACSGLAAMPDAIEASATQAVAQAAREQGVAMTAVSGTYNMIHPDVAVRAAGHARLATLAAACAGLGTRVITLCTGTRDAQDQWHGHPDNTTPEAWRDLLASMERAIEIADEHDVLLGIEPELANVVNSAQRARALIDQLGSERLRIVLDPANLFEVATLAEQRDTVSAAIDLLADRIVMGHAKDRHADGRFATAGTGVLDYAHYLAGLQRVGFNGPLITHGLAAEEAAGVAVFLRAALAEAGIEVRP
ncbi:sugar phosphate isomerase/epimerase family protein [Sphaerotilus mobilis]|uniref:Sugar phosphate isomerase/epimerase n=1 Tax=Sphaerotilus mobilis TaxID=47994 RepID=A0A4Q7LFU1_9BURK|nr:sugar phosphate isomerase/epimerase [Sphaerotilus mobilis]RZS52922.1 sugar phosphate isomerase/epimerase [Sphaerotilus mobilis]